MLTHPSIPQQRSNQISNPFKWNTHGNGIISIPEVEKFDNSEHYDFSDGGDHDERGSRQLANIRGSVQHTMKHLSRC